MEPGQVRRRPRSDRRSWSTSGNRELDYGSRKPSGPSRAIESAFYSEYEWHDDAGRWSRSYGNELWEFDERGLMRRREASINDVLITEQAADSTGPRPAPAGGTNPAFRKSNEIESSGEQSAARGQLADPCRTAIS